MHQEKKLFFVKEIAKAHRGEARGLITFHEHTRNADILIKTLEMSDMTLWLNWPWLCTREARPFINIKVRQELANPIDDRVD